MVWFFAPDVHKNPYFLYGSLQVVTGQLHRRAHGDSGGPQARLRKATETPRGLGKAQGGPTAAQEAQKFGSWPHVNANFPYLLY